MNGFFTTLFVPILSNLRHSMTTRFLLTGISSYFFHKDKTLDAIHEQIAQDAQHLYRNGLDVTC